MNEVSKLWVDNVVLIFFPYNISQKLTAASTHTGLYTEYM